MRHYDTVSAYLPFHKSDTPSNPSPSGTVQEYIICSIVSSFQKLSLNTKVSVAGPQVQYTVVKFVLYHNHYIGDLFDLVLTINKFNS